MSLMFTIMFGILGIIMKPPQKCCILAMGWFGIIWAAVISAL